MSAAAYSATAWAEQRAILRDSRARCMAVVAAALGCPPDALPGDVRRAIAMHGHECYQVALAYGGTDDDYAELARRECPTVPALPATRVGRRGALGQRG